MRLQNSLRVAKQTMLTVAKEEYENMFSVLMCHFMEKDDTHKSRRMLHLSFSLAVHEDHASDS